MLYRCLSFSVTITAIVLLSGCGPGKLEVNKTMVFDGKVEAMSIDLESQSKPQTVYIDFTSNGGEVSVYVFKEEDAKGDDGLTLAREAKALAKKTLSKGGDLSTEIPAGTPVRVVVRSGGRNAEVKIRVSNQKT